MIICPNFAQYYTILTEFLKNNSPDIIPWTDAGIAAFEALRTSLNKKPVLQLPDISAPFILQTDASEHGIGAVLKQPHKKDQNKLVPVQNAIIQQLKKKH